jgi:hypothetical protein
MAKSDIRLYGNNFNGAVIKDLNDLNKKIEEEQDPEKLLKLRMQRLYRGLEINAGNTKRDLRGYFPY